MLGLTLGASRRERSEKARPIYLDMQVGGAFQTQYPLAIRLIRSGCCRQLPRLIPAFLTQCCPI
jgi:hypothetical protein